MKMVFVLDENGKLLHIHAKGCPNDAQFMSITRSKTGQIVGLKAAGDLVVIDGLSEVVVDRASEFLEKLNDF